MRSRLFFSLAAATGLIVAGAAGAAPLTQATWSTTLQGVALTITNANGTCTDVPGSNHTQLDISSCPGGLLPTGAATSTNYSVSLTVSLFAFTQFTTGGSINIHTKASLGTDVVSIDGAASSASANGMFVNGGVSLKAAVHINKGVNASKQTAAPTTLLKVPLSVGKQGTFTDVFFVSTAPHYITVDFYAWTPHTLTFTGLTSLGKALPDVTAKGSFNLDAMGSGTVTLVSPSKISIDGDFAPIQRRTASFTTLKLTYAPEPGTLLLLGAAVAGLVWVESRKRK